MNPYRPEPDITDMNEAFMMEANASLNKIDYEHLQPSREKPNSDNATNFFHTNPTTGGIVQQLQNQPATSQAYEQDPVSMICASTNESMNTSPKECAGSIHRLQGWNGPQMISGLEDSDRITPKLQDMTSSFPIELPKEPSAAPFSFKSNLEDNTWQDSSDQCESDDSHTSHLEELIFPDKKVASNSSDWEMQSRESKSNSQEFTEKKTYRCSPQRVEDGTSPSFPNMRKKNLHKRPIGMLKGSTGREDEHFASHHAERKKKGTKDARQYLGINFIPSNWDVIFGRGKDSYDHIGNRRLKIMVAMNLRKYSDSKSQVEKFHVVDSVVRQIREASPTGAGFVKREADGDWYVIATAVAQQKVARTFRDSMIGLLRGNARLSEEEKCKNAIEAQNTIFRSCQIRFSGQSMEGDSQASSLTAKKPTDKEI